MLRSSLAKYSCLAILIAAPASAIDITYSSPPPGNWYGDLTNFTVVTFDGLAENAYSGPAASLVLQSASFYGFFLTPGPLNSFMQIVAENNAGAPWYNYGGTGPDGTAVANPRVLRGTGTGGPSVPVGFEIVLPTAVTAIGFQIMSSLPFNVNVKIGGNSISDPGGAYPTGSLTTAGSHGRTFFGVTSTTPFTTIDIIGSNGGPSEYLVLDNVVFGNPVNTSTAEPQSAVLLATGLGLMVLAMRMKKQHAQA